MNNKTFVVIAVLLAVFSFLAGSMWTKNNYLKQDRMAEKLEEEEEEGEGGKVAGEVETREVEEKRPEYPKTVGDFSVLEREVCFEEGKPLVYFFGHSGCPHCLWEEPVVKEAMEPFGEAIVFHNNMDEREKDREVFEEYSEINPGDVPFLVLGCKYARVGSGEQAGEEEEIKALTALTCKLTDGEPKGVCEGVEGVDVEE